MAGKLNTMTEYVASTTLERATWPQTTVIASDLAGAVSELKGQDGGPILVAGSRSIVHRLLADGLVDELHLQVFPLLLGSGARVYPESAEKTALELIDASALPGGVVLQTYATTATADRAG